MQARFNALHDVSFPLLASHNLRDRPTKHFNTHEYHADQQGPSYCRSVGKEKAHEPKGHESSWKKREEDTWRTQVSEVKHDLDSDERPCQALQELLIGL
jgi:hypothetical protein